MALRQLWLAVMWYVLLLAGARMPAQAAAAGHMEVDHVAISVADVKASVAFYHDVFGFQQIPMPVTFAAWMSMGRGMTLHIVGRRREPVTNSKWDHLSIACENLDTMIATLDARHIPWESLEGKPEPQVRFDGVRQIFIRDPDGYWIEINDALKKR